ncbi:MAG: mycothiol conjugate amidase Mca [Actinomycetes bacterium]
MAEPLCLMQIHAHPDDESSKGAGTVARYLHEGIRSVLVCCTGGEEGDILNPALDLPDVRERLAEVRREELEIAVRVIGYDHYELLGYRDSGMPGSDANARADAFANAPLDEAVGRLVEIIRRERPQVLVTYSDDQEGYPHPDHLKVHDISRPAMDAAADPNAYPEAGEPWQIAKLYYTVWSKARMLAIHEKFVELGLESPFGEEWFKRPSQDHRITTQVSLEGYEDVRVEALLAHATQVDPASPFWFGLPRDVSRAIHPFDDYVLAHSEIPVDLPETDLFAGFR